MIANMDRARLLILATVAGVALVFGGVVGAFAATTRFSPAAAAFAALTAASPSPSFRPNEHPAHERNESAAQEQAENNGTFGPHDGGRPCGGHSNEDPTDEKGETAAQEAAENAPCPTAPTPRSSTSAAP
jgi:hypothetical protein